MIRELQRQDKDKTEWKPCESDRVSSIHFVGSAYEANSIPTLSLGYEVKEKKVRRTLITEPFPKTSKIKENDNNNDYEVLLPVFTTKSQPAVTRSTSYNWPATSLASLY